MTTNTNSPLGGDPLLTMDQAAEYLAIPKATLYTWRSRPGSGGANGGPRAVKIGGMIRFRRSDLDSWLEQYLEPIQD
jgi:predicted DNA-binding transcriptional regulator AlpA